MIGRKSIPFKQVSLLGFSRNDAVAAPLRCADPSLSEKPSMTDYPTPPYPEQQQSIPGRTEAMDPRPDHGEESYRGSGRLAGKKAIVTGGDSGIGRAVALAFAREGADVLISYLDEHNDAEATRTLVEAEGRQAVLVAGDALSNVVSFDDEDTIERTVNKIPVDGLTRAFEVMLANKIKTTGEWHCAAWVALLERGEMAGQLDGWLETIDDKLDAILESLSDVQRWVAKSRFAERVFEMLRNDLRALRLVIDVAKALDEIGSQETDANDSASDPVKRATLFDAAVTTAIAASPRLMESWSRIRRR